MEEHMRKTTLRTAAFGWQKPCRDLSVASFVLLFMVISGCGGGFDVNHVTVTLSPAAATVQVNGQVKLTAAEHHDCSGCGPIYSWDIPENGGANCTWVDTPPDGPCPAGTIQAQLAGTGLFGPTGTYFAPATGGTFHVVVSDLLTLSLTAKATSVITVSGSTT
jgi:hypothetical protein